MKISHVLMAVFAGASVLAVPAVANAAANQASNSSVRSVRLVLAAPRLATLSINGGTTGGGGTQTPNVFTPPSRIVDPRIVPGNGVILRIPRHGGPRSRGTGRPR